MGTVNSFFVSFGTRFICRRVSGFTYYQVVTGRGVFYVFHIYWVVICTGVCLTNVTTLRTTRRVFNNGVGNGGVVHLGFQGVGVKVGVVVFFKSCVIISGPYLFTRLRGDTTGHGTQTRHVTIQVDVDWGWSVVLPRGRVYAFFGVGFRLGFPLTFRVSPFLF